MLETSIYEVLSKDEITSKIFLGVFAKDELPLELKYPCCFVCNTAPRHNRGEHWLAFFFNKNGFCNFFDSYGKDPNDFGLSDYLEKTSLNWSFNKKRIQGMEPYCGHYCIFYLLFRARGKDINFFRKFGIDYSKNDREITKLMEIY
jgi:hypothetical protein